MKTNWFSRILLALSVCLSAYPEARAGENGLVRVKLFSSHKVDRVYVRPLGTWRLNGQPYQGPLMLSQAKGQIALTDLRGRKRLVRKATFEGRRGLLKLTLKNGALREVNGKIDVEIWGGHLRVINTVDIESYAAGVAPGEMASVPATVPALMAQMVASRSYLLTMKGRHWHHQHDFCDGPHCQVYLGLHHVNQKALEAARLSSGQYLTYNGRALAAFYHDTCGGSTSAAEDAWRTRRLPYLKALRDGPGEGYCKNSPHAHWIYKIDRAKMKKILRKRGWLGAKQNLGQIGVIRRDRFGRALQILIQSDRPRTVSAQDFRRAINTHFEREVLPSTKFVVSAERTQFSVTGRGWGHGVGLCQWGSAEMAKQGQSYKQILTHYFPGSTLTLLPNPGHSFIEDIAQAKPLFAPSPALSKIRMRDWAWTGLPTYAVRPRTASTR